MTSGPITRAMFILCSALVWTGFCLPAEGFEYAELSFVEQEEYRDDLEAAGSAVIPLAGRWECSHGKSGPLSCTVPLAYFGVHEPVSLTREFALADSLEYLDWEVIIPAYRHRIDLFVNEKLVVSARGGFSHFRAALRNELLNFGGTNSIRLVIENDLNLSGSVPLTPGLFESQTCSGVFSDVYLVGRNGWSLHEPSWRYDFEQEGIGATPRVGLRVGADIVHGMTLPADSTAASATSAEVELVAVLRSSDDGREIGTGRLTVEEYLLSSNTHPLSLPDIDVRPWSAEYPALYDLAIFLIFGEDTLSFWSGKIGFRAAAVERGHLSLNGDPVVLRAIDYIAQDSNGLPARPVTVRSDLQAIKELGLSAIRVFGDDVRETILDAADEIGLWVLVDGGMRSVPSSLIETSLTEKTRSGPLTRAIRLAQQHPSVCAIGAGQYLDFADSLTAAEVNAAVNNIRQSAKVPAYVEATGELPEHVDPDFVLSARPPYAGAAVGEAGRREFPVVYSRIGWPSEYGAFAEVDGATADWQTYMLQTQLAGYSQHQNAAGFIVHAYADYRGAIPLLAQGRVVQPEVYSYGLYDLARRAKPAAATLEEFLKSPERFPAVRAVAPSETHTVMFPVIALASLLLLSISIRSNNVLRQSLRRVFRHAHGFFADIRFRRHVPSSHAMLLWLMNSVAIGLTAASVLHWMRDSLYLDYFLGFVGVDGAVKVSFARVLWSPGQLISVSVIFFLCFFVLHAVYLKAIAGFFKPRVSLNQAWNYTIWSSSSLLFLLPLAAILNRMLEIPALVTPSLVVIAIVFLWSWYRLMSALQNGFQTGLVRISLLFFVVSGCIVGAAYLAADHWRFSPAYWQWLVSVYPHN